MNREWPLRLPWRRTYSAMKHILPAKTVRNRFLEYFTRERDHTFVKSSPVIPYFDSSIPFVNAGMCQFKRVFTGEEQVNFTKATNSQKCIRVGGKHNDLNLVGVDSYHHTFFEMLGNWSFGAYGKKEACNLAWDLLTSPPYNIPPSKLFVTYFGGDEKLGLPADDEVRNIWLEIGVPGDRILPFGMKENFWEMGTNGPCGTCTEIHVSLNDEFCSRSDLVNANNPLLCELWNIVFIKYNKTNESLKPLPNEFVDTGMGFERLTTLLQQKTSSYHTDLFTPFYDHISKVTKAPAYAGTFESENLDASYRRLADFSRMATVAIADNVFPDLNAKLRRILRRALLIAQIDFKCEKAEQLIQDLSSLTAEALQDTFPEVGNKLNQVKLIVEHENKLMTLMAKVNKNHWRLAQKKNPLLKKFCLIQYPNLPSACDYLQRHLSQSECSVLKPEIVFQLYDTFGLDKPVVELLARELKLQINWNEVEDEFHRIKEQSRKGSQIGPAYKETLQRLGIKTDDSAKRSHVRKDDGTYQFPDVRSKLLAIVDGENVVSVVDDDRFNLNEISKSLVNSAVNVADKSLGFVFDRTNFHPTSRYDSCNAGHITFQTESGSGEFMVERVDKVDHVVIHFAKPIDKTCETLKTGITAILRLDPEYTLKLMRNYSIIHLLLPALRHIFPICYEKDYSISSKCAKLTYRVVGKDFDVLKDKKSLESKLKEYVSSAKISVSTVQPTVSVLDTPGIQMIPCKIYPYEELRLITVSDEKGNIISREPCEAIHVPIAADIKHFDITKLSATMSSDLKLVVYTGDRHRVTTEDDVALRNDMEKYENEILNLIERDDAKAKEIVNANQQLSLFMYKTMSEFGSMPPPRPVYCESYTETLQHLVVNASEKLEKLPRETVIRELTEELRKQTDEDKFAVYFCLLNYAWHRHDSFKVDILYRIPFPAMMFNYRFRSHMLTGVSHIPEAFVTDDFNAQTWMESVIVGYNKSVIQEDDMENYCFIRFEVQPTKVFKFIDKFTSRGIRIAKQHVKSDKTPNVMKNA